MIVHSLLSHVLNEKSSKQNFETLLEPKRNPIAKISFIVDKILGVILFIEWINRRGHPTMHMPSHTAVGGVLTDKSNISPQYSRSATKSQSEPQFGGLANTPLQE